MAVPLPSVAVVIVTFNSREDIAPCLDAIVGRLEPLEATVTVVDNQSSDGTPQLIRARWPGVRVVEAGGNLGFARANNIGARATSSDVVLFLNPDTVAAPGAIQALVTSLWNRADAAIAGPRLVDAHNRPELSWGPPISPWGEFTQKVAGAFYQRGIGATVRRIERLSRTDRNVSWVSGACLAARRLDLDAVGYFDERYFMYTEDVDLCVAMQARGRHVIYVAQAEVVHVRGQSASRHPETERMRRLSQLAYYQKHHPAWAPVLRAYLRATGKG